MLAAASQLFAQSLPLAVKFTRQIIPPVIATLIAALVITGFNKVFSSHLQQPRMAALHAAEEASAAAPAAPSVAVAKPAAGAVTETITIYEEADATERLAEKDANQEAGKDQTAKLASTEPERVVAPQPVRVTVQPPRPEPKLEAKQEPRIEPRIEQRRVAAVEPLPAAPRATVSSAPVAPAIVAVPPSVVAPQAVAVMPATQERAPQPPYQHAYPQQQYPQPQYSQPQVQAPYQPPYAQQPVAQQPNVVMGTPPMVTVPDRQRQLAQGNVEEAQAETPRPNGAIGTFVNVFKPSNWFARAREFGEKIEQAGNDILPNIRQQ